MASPKKFTSWNVFRCAGWFFSWEHNFGLFSVGSHVVPGVFFELKNVDKQNPNQLNSSCGTYVNICASPVWGEGANLFSPELQVRNLTWIPKKQNIYIYILWKSRIA